MTAPKLLPTLRAGLLVAAISICSAATAQQTSTDREDAALAYAQCVRDNGYEEFPDPKPDGFQFLIKPQDVERFKKAAEACRDLAPDGMRDEGVTPEQLDALLKLAQCVRENGVPEFPDPDGQGLFNLGGISSGPGDPRIESAMAACREFAQDAPIKIGG